MAQKRTFLTLTALLLIPAALSAKEPIPTPKDTPLMGEMDPYLLKTLYKSPDTDASLTHIADDPEFKTLIKKHNLSLFSGPMLGCVTDKNARFWVRTAHSATVQVVVGKGRQLSIPIKSNAVTTSKNADFTALLDIEGLGPFEEYYYDVLLNGQSVLKNNPAKFRTSPAKGQKAKFDVGFGGGARYVSEKERIWDTIASIEPAAFLFLGDNLYIDLPNSRTKQRVHYYRRQLRPEFRRMSSSAAIYAIWDDHDFGKNDTSGGPDTFKPDWKLPVWRVFKEKSIEIPFSQLDLHIKEGDVKIGPA